MTDQIEIELFVCMNEDGDFAVGTDSGDTATDLADNCGGVCMRTVKLKVKIAPPQITEAEVTVPDEAGETVSAQAAE